MPLRLNPATGELFLQGLDWVDFARAPTATDNTYEAPFGWLDTSADEWYVCVDITAGVATWKAAGGDVTGPASSTDNAIVRFDGTTGKLLQNSNAILDNAGDLTLSSPLLVPSGGTGLSSATAYAVICGGTTGTGAFQSIASIGTSGQVLTSNGAAALPTFQTPSFFTWNEVTGTSATLVAQTGYVANNAGLVTLTLPVVASIGDQIQIVGKGAGLFKIAQNASQKIHFIDTDTTTGTGGSLTAIEQYASIELVCITANNDWAVLDSAGNFTIV
jgi:hypothetical protein